MAAATIALLDNDPAFLALLHDLLTGEGYRTLRWCPGGRDDPLVLLRAARPDLVVLDLGLGSGRWGDWALARRLRDDLATADIPVILLAGAAAMLPDSAEVSRAIRCRVLQRPIAHGDLCDLHDLCDLLATIEALFGHCPAARGANERAPGTHPAGSVNV